MNGMYIVQETVLQSPAPRSNHAGLKAGRDRSRVLAAPQQTSAQIDALHTPCLLLDLLGANIQRMPGLASAAGLRLRPRAKWRLTSLSEEHGILDVPPGEGPSEGRSRSCLTTPAGRST
jgi:hypothetical protein